MNKGRYCAKEWDDEVLGEGEDVMLYMLTSGTTMLPQLTALMGFEAGRDASLCLLVLNAVLISEAET